MRRHVVVSWMIILGLTVALTAIAAKAPTGPIVISACKAKKAPVTFSHATHAKQKVACKTCHHKGEGQKCSDAKCHAGKAEGKKLGCAEMSPAKNPFHVKCLGCHKKEGKGPKVCAECHKS